MGPSGDQKERGNNGQHDGVGGLSVKERSASDGNGSEQQTSSSNASNTSAEQSGRSANGNRGNSATESARHIQAAGAHRSAGVSPGKLKGAEEAGAGASMLGGKSSTGGRAAGIAANGLLGAEKKGADKSPFSYTGGGSSGGGGARSFVKKHQKKLIAGALAGVGIIPILILLLFILGALKIPHFIENMAAWRFAKLTRAYRESMTNVMGEKNAFDALDDEGKKAATAKYGKYEAFDKINRLRPNKVIQSLNTGDRLQYEYKTTLTGKEKLVSITIADSEDISKKTTIKVPTGKFNRIIHPIQALDQYKTISVALDSAMKAHDPKIPAVVRSAATKAVIKKAGGSLKGLVASHYVGTNNTEANAKFTALTSQYEELKSQLNSLESQRADLITQLGEAEKARGQSQDTYNKLKLQQVSVDAELDRYFKSGVVDIDKMNTILNKSSDLFDDLANASRDYNTLHAQTETLRAQQKTINKNIADIGKQIVDVKEKIGAGVSDRDAKVTIQQDTYAAVKDTGGVAGASTDNLRDIENEANDAESKCVKDPTCIGQEVDQGGGTPSVVDDVIEKGLNPGSAKAIAEKVVGFANPIYDIAVPVCMAYDGSKITAEALDAQSNATQRESMLMLAVGDQQKDGTQFNKTMANAVNWKLGNVQNSNTMRRVSGKPVDTTQGVGGQRSVLGQYGQYTIFDVMFGLGNPFNDFADKLCPKLTNIWVGVGLGVANIALVTIGSIFTGGGAAGAEAAAATAGREAATKTLKIYVDKMITSFTVKGAIQSFGKGGRFAVKYAKDVAKYGAAAAGATFLARIIVQSQAGSLNSGLETDAAFADNVDNGTDQFAGNMMRSNYYARPCTNAEIIQNQQMDRAEIAMQNQSKSSFDRYLALSNPNSLSSRMVITSGSLLDRSTFSRALNNTANLLNPLSMTSHVFASANGQAAFAAGTKDLEDYGNVQWCYSASEQQKMKQDTSYSSPSENEYQLDISGKEDEIDTKYGKCFDTEVTVGQLLANGDITRNEEGDVLNEGDCSPEQLGANNPTYGDLVFRYRLKHSYDGTTDTLLGIQDPAAISNDQTQGATGAIPTGTAQELAKQILNNANISFQTPSERTAMEYIASTGKARDCGAPAMSPKLLGVILAASSKYKIVVGVLDDGHHCGDDAHDIGLAVDLNGVNPLTGSGGTGTHITWSSSEMSILTNFYQDIGQILTQAGGGRMGQQQCFQGAPVPKVSGIKYFDDACTHLHVDVKT